MKIARYLLIISFLLLILVIPVYAEEDDDSSKTQEELITELETSIDESLGGEIPETAKDLLGQNGIDEFNTETISNFNFLNLLTGLFE